MQQIARLAFVMLFCGCMLMGCGYAPQVSKTNTAQSAAPVEPERVVIPVEAQKPIRGNISEYLDTVSRVEAERRVEVASKGSGLCLEVLAEEGDSVQKGQPLAELDKKDIEAQRRQTELQVRQTRADYERAKQAFEYGFLSGMEYENAKYALENALAARDVQQIQLENATIRAPIDGIITRRNIHEGQLVTTGTPVFQIVDPSSYVINIDVAEKDIPRIKKGQLAKFTVLSLEDAEFDARVSRVNPGIDPASGMVKVRLEIDPKSRAKLRDAAFVRVRLVMDTRENALLIPKDALLEENTRKYVFIVTNTPSSTEASGAPSTEPRTYARRVPVEVGLEDSQYAEIMSGIDDDTWVITVGQKNLRTDSEIRVTTASAEVATSGHISAEEALAAAKVKHEELKKRQETEKQEAAQRLAEERRRAAANTDTRDTVDTEDSPTEDDL